MISHRQRVKLIRDLRNEREELIRRLSDSVRDKDSAWVSRSINTYSSVLEMLEARGPLRHIALAVLALAVALVLAAGIWQVPSADVHIEAIATGMGYRVAQTQPIVVSDDTRATGIELTYVSSIDVPKLGVAASSSESRLAVAIESEAGTALRAFEVDSACESNLMPVGTDSLWISARAAPVRMSLSTSGVTSVRWVNRQPDSEEENEGELGFGEDILVRRVGREGAPLGVGLYGIKGLSRANLQVDSLWFHGTSAVALGSAPPGSMITSGRIVMPQTGEEFKLQKGALLILRDLTGKLTYDYAGSAFKLVFDGSAHNVLLKYGEYEDDLKPTYLKWLLYKYTSSVVVPTIVALLYLALTNLLALWRRPK